MLTIQRKQRSSTSCRGAMNKKVLHRAMLVTLVAVLLGSVALWASSVRHGFSAIHRREDTGERVRPFMEANPRAPSKFWSERVVWGLGVWPKLIYESPCLSLPPERVKTRSNIVGCSGACTRERRRKRRCLAQGIAIFRACWSRPRRKPPWLPGSRRGAPQGLGFVGKIFFLPRKKKPPDPSRRRA